MAPQGRMMWSTESSFNYLEYARLSPSPSSSSSSTLLSSPANPSYQRDDDIQDVLGRGAAPLKAIYVAIVDTDEYSQCLMKQDDWDALTGHFGVDPGFVDACMNDGLASDGRTDNGTRDGKVSFWNISKVARSNPSTKATTFLQLGTYVAFDPLTCSSTLLVVLKGKDPVILPCWYSPRPADDPFGVLASMYKSIVQSWALYFQAQDRELLVAERSAVTHPESFDTWRIWGLGRVYTRVKAELKTLERMLEFMGAEFEGYTLTSRSNKAANLSAREMLRSYLCQTKRLIDRADFFLERVRTLNSIHLSQSTLVSNQANNQIAQQTRTLSNASARDSISMRTMAAIQLCFLPSTLVSAFFSMGFFSSLNSTRAWLFPTVALPLTLFTIAAWYVWQRNRYVVNAVYNYNDVVSHPTNTAPAPPHYDISRNATPVNLEKTHTTNGGATLTNAKTTESLPQTHQLRAPPSLSTVPGAGSSAHQTYFTGSSSVTLTKVQSPREEKMDAISSGSDSIITVKPANLSPPQPSRGLHHPLDMPNLEKVITSPSVAPTTSTRPPQAGERSSWTSPSQHDRQRQPPPFPSVPPTHRASQDSKRNSGYQQNNRPSVETVNRKSVDQRSVSAPSVAGSEWFTS
ncbi:MAG: hypothetical protein M1840_007019 [Geoglossum simile]|nr:MAG: hypothetical protein M1840_007019 [Geoglossum simile]